MYYIYPDTPGILKHLKIIWPLMGLVAGPVVEAQAPLQDPWLILGNHPLLIYSSSYFGQCDSLNDCFQIDPGFIMLAQWQKDPSVSVKNVYAKAANLSEATSPLEWCHVKNGKPLANWVTNSIDTYCNCNIPPLHFYCFRLGEGETHVVKLRAANQQHAEIESFIFRGFVWSPRLKGWRPAFAGDSLFETMGARYSPNFRQDVLRDFKPVSSIIRTKRPAFIQFSLSTPFFAQDSLIEYYWGPAPLLDNVPWQRTAGLITAPVTGSNSNWILALRKTGQPGAITYQVAFEPRWFETIFFRIFLVITFFLFWGMVWLHKKNKRLNADLNLQKQLYSQLLSMKAIITPHFMLNAISSLLFLHANRKWGQAKRFTLGLSDFLTDTLHHRDDLYDTLQNELDRTTRFVRLQQLSFDFEYSTQTNNMDWPELLEVPSGILQPVVENGIKYNIAANSYKGNIIIEAYKKDGRFVLEVVSLSGIQTPIPTNHLLSKYSLGIGLKWVQNRLSIHNQLYPHKSISLETTFEKHESRVRFIFSQTENQ
jgi:hypothetical protein